MITNGVDPYNGSTSVMNQDSPYVDAAVADAQRAGVAVYAIYFGDAGIRGASADNSGQNYLAQLTQAHRRRQLLGGRGQSGLHGSLPDAIPARHRRDLRRHLPRAHRQRSADAIWST